MNFEELVSAVKQKFPKYEWEVVDLPYNNLTVLSKILASSKLWFTPCGSNVNNVIFMQPKSGLLVNMHRYIDYPNQATIYNTNVYAVAYNNNHIFHHSKGNCNISLALYGFKTILHVLETDRWECDIESFHPINSTLIMEVMTNNSTKKLITRNHGNAVGIMDDDVFRPMSKFLNNTKYILTGIKEYV